ncbi:MAG: hypothetical protein WBX25_37645 [Rhodomicrobium sp.]
MKAIIWPDPTYSSQVSTPKADPGNPSNRSYLPDKGCIGTCACASLFEPQALFDHLMQLREGFALHVRFRVFNLDFVKHLARRRDWR